MNQASRFEPGTLYQDTNEPPYIEEALALANKVERAALNAHGMADYAWLRADGQECNVERKTWHELVSDINNVERQLFKYLQRPDSVTILLMEGLAVPCAEGTRTYKLAGRGIKAQAVEQVVRRNGMQLYYAWLHQVGQYLEVQAAADQTATAYAISAFFQSDQKPEEKHTTFRRHLKRVTWAPNPQVGMLMNMSTRLDIGEKTATNLINAFGTVWNVLNARPKDLALVQGVGVPTATRLLRAVGRPDV